MSTGDDSLDKDSSFKDGAPDWLLHLRGWLFIEVRQVSRGREKSIICGYCGRDISVHEVIGFELDGKVELISKVAAPVSLPMKETAEEDRRRDLGE
jgi:hypothetical protein